MTHLPVQEKRNSIAALAGISGFIRSDIDVPERVSDGQLNVDTICSESAAIKMENGLSWGAA
jgi:hypothetical protein